MGEARSNSRAGVDVALTVLGRQKDEWIGVTIDQKILILKEVQRDLQEVSERWIEETLRAKGIPSGSHGEGEEWVILSMVSRYARLLTRSLMDIRRQGIPRIPGGFRIRSGNQLVARVFPQTMLDRILLKDITGEVWLRPGVSPDQVKTSQARFYRSPEKTGTLCLVLGAGNIAVLPATDTLYKLFVEKRVVALKMNPANAYLGPILGEAFRSLILRGFLRIVYGEAEEGEYLCNHPLVDEIHLTGSLETFEAIVFGAGKTGLERKRKRRPITEKRIAAELGNVTPAIIVPGPWDEKAIRRQAVVLSSWLVANAGFNCLAPRVIVQHRGWDLRDAVVRQIEEVLSETPTRKAYYPGAAPRHREFVESHPEAWQSRVIADNHLPWTFISHVDPSSKDDICFRKEAFCSLFAETALDAGTIPEFIEKAVDFANETLWGSLTATIIVHPESLRDPRISDAVERAIERLQYGLVAVNLRPDYAFLILLTTWGAYPKHDLFDAQSGIGSVHNALMIDSPQKSVLRGPFFMTPDPFVVTAKGLSAFGRKMAGFQACPSWRKLPGLMYSALRA